MQVTLTNVAKHALAREVRVSNAADAAEVRLSVTDDGQGFDMPSTISTSGPTAGIGLMGMRERIDLLGGQVEIVSLPGRSTPLVSRVALGEGI